MTTQLIIQAATGGSLLDPRKYRVTYCKIGWNTSENLTAQREVMAQVETIPISPTEFTDFAHVRTNSVLYRALNKMRGISTWDREIIRGYVQWLPQIVIWRSLIEPLDESEEWVDICQKLFTHDGRISMFDLFCANPCDTAAEYFAKLDSHVRYTPRDLFKAVVDMDTRRTVFKRCLDLMYVVSATDGLIDVQRAVTELCGKGDLPVSDMQMHLWQHCVGIVGEAPVRVAELFEKYAYPTYQTIGVGRGTKLHAAQAMYGFYPICGSGHSTLAHNPRNPGAVLQPRGTEVTCAKCRKMLANFGNYSLMIPEGIDNRLLSYTKKESLIYE
jgi:hypothetical protein